MERTGATVGAPAVRQELGLDGSGIGVAVVDSGITSWHDDLANVSTNTERVSQFVDFVNGATAPYDDYGHGTHVAGIITGNGFDSSGARSGIAPAASLVVLKVLDGSGRGRISDVIAAFDYVLAHGADYHIRVVNVSVATGVYESFDTDPLTQAAKRVVDAGIVIVASAGNAGRDQQGNTQYGGVTAPGNAPWVLSVGASSHMGTIDRSDDTIAAFSSRGPTAVDRRAKPDVVAPGVGIESLSTPGSALYNSMSAYLLNGTVATSYPPYLSLSGTSMAAPVVTGSVALMLQANPALTPNAVKAILQYTAQAYQGYDALTEGAGFLNTRGAVELAHYFAAPGSTVPPATDMWTRQILWGNLLVSGGQLTASANAWTQGLVWGAPTTSTGDAASFGVICSAGCDTANPVWSAWHADGGSPNVVWGQSCGGGDCPSGTPWVVDTPGSSEPQTVVWGSSYGTDTVVWGSNDGFDTVVWGSSDNGDTVVWGSSCSDPSCQPVIWPHK
jgi:serine protease AprX